MNESDLEKYLDPDKQGSLSRGDIGIIQKILDDQYKVTVPPAYGASTYAKKILFWMQQADFYTTRTYDILADFFENAFKKDHDDVSKLKILKSVLDKILSKKAMENLYKQAVQAAKEKKQPKYKMDYTIMKQVMRNPVPVNIPEEQKKKSLMQPIEYAPDLH